MKDRRMPITLKPGTFIVLEGLDATGKTTQLDIMRAGAKNGFFGGQNVVFTHQPSGSTAVGREVYRITEDHPIISPWARQFLHLASHAEHYETLIIPSLDEGHPVIMDRCWWSTVAYGYFGGKLYQDMDFDEFVRLVQLPTKGQMPKVVFLFDQPYAPDHHNTTAVRNGYKQLYDHFYMKDAETTVVKVPTGDPEAITTFLWSTISDLGLVADPA